jgi:hypothetical protein
MLDTWLLAALAVRDELILTRHHCPHLLTASARSSSPPLWGLLG